MTMLFTLATTGLMLLVSGAIVAYSAHSAQRAADRVLAITARRVRSELAEEGGLKSAAELVREENEVLERADGAITVVGADGRILGQSRHKVPRWPRAGDDGWRVEVVEAPNASIVIGIPWWKSRALLWNQALILLGLVLCVAVVTAAGAWVLVGRTLLPIRMLARQTDAASAASLSVQLDAPSDDAELVELVATLNRLLRDLTRTAAEQGRFYAAASHELRTPLQALSGHLELALTRPRDREEYHAVVEEAYGQTRRLSRLVRELLLLNQLHQRTSRPPSEPTDLAETLDLVLHQLRGAVKENAVQVVTRVPPEAVTEGPPQHVEIILRNLVENAAKYALPESNVTLRVAADAGEWLFEIYNECPDSLEVRQEEVFEPFFRPDASRSSRTGGNGLGLAICKAVADANCWSLKWTREAQGVRAQVRFPGYREVPAVQPMQESSPCAATALASR
jgi:signal transduction histidine kinase